MVQRVRQRGLALVPPSEREGIGPPAPVGPAYRQRLTAAWQGHQALADPADPAAAADLERFIDSQRLRDRAMERAGQVIRRVAAQPPGEPLRLGLEREGQTLETIAPLASVQP